MTDSSASLSASLIVPRRLDKYALVAASVKYLFTVRVYYAENPSTPYVDYIIGATCAARIGDRVVLIYPQGNINKPAIMGVLHADTIPEVTIERDQKLYNVPYLRNLIPAINANILIDFIGGDANSPVILQGYNPASKVRVIDENLGVTVDAYQPQWVTPYVGGDVVPVVFSGGDISDGVAIKPGEQCDYAVLSGSFYVGT